MSLFQLSDTVIGSFDDARWNDVVARIKEKKGNITVFAFIDWTAGINSPFGVFSQILTPEQQREFLVKVITLDREGSTLRIRFTGALFPRKTIRGLPSASMGPTTALQKKL